MIDCYARYDKLLLNIEFFLLYIFFQNFLIYSMQNELLRIQAHLSTLNNVYIKIGTLLKYEILKSII